MKARSVLAAIVVLGGALLVVLAWRTRLQREHAQPAFEERAQASPAEVRVERVTPAAEIAERVPAAAPEAEEAASMPDADSLEPALDAAGILGSVLVHGEGVPIEGASVRAFPADSGDDAEPSARAVSAADGRFHLRGLRAFADYRVEADAPGFVHAEELLPTGRYAGISLRRGVSLAGRVLRAADRSPLADVELDAQGGTGVFQRPLSFGRARTDANGAFVLAGLPAGEVVSLAVRAPGRLVELVRLNLDASTEGYELLLAEPHTVTVQLVDLRSGAPLARLAGRFDDRGPMTASRGGSAFTTDGEGRFELRWGPRARQFTHNLAGDGAEPTELSFEVAVAGYCLTRAVVDVHAEGVLVLPLTRGATVAGRVTDDGGAPVAGARVELQPRELKILTGPDQSAGGFPPGISIVEPPGRFALTGADGAYSLAQLAPRPEPAALRASFPGWFRSDVPVPALAPDANVRVDIELQRGATLRGRVVADGEPFLGTVRAQDGVRRRTCHVNESGEYALDELVPGELTLSVWPEDLAAVRVGDEGSLYQETLTVRSGETLEHDIVLDAVRIGASVTGSVVSSEGQPLEDVIVYVVDPQAMSLSTGPYGTIRNAGTTTESDSGGRFELSVPASEETVEIVALQAGVEVRRHVPPGASDVELVLPARGTLAITLVDPATGSPPPHVRNVRWWPSGTPRRELQSGSILGLAPAGDGAFRLDLAEGAWNVDLEVDGFARTFLADVDVRAGEVTRASLELGVGTTLVLDFHRESGAGGPPIRVTVAEIDDYARAIAGDMMWWGEAELRCTPIADASGRATLRHLSPGTYELVNPTEGWVLEPAQFEVPDVERHTVEVRCSPGG